MDKFEDADEEEEDFIFSSHIDGTVDGTAAVASPSNRRLTDSVIVEEEDSAVVTAVGQRQSLDDVAASVTYGEKSNDAGVGDEDTMIDHTVPEGTKESVFDEKKFFAAPRFPSHVLEEAKSMIYERLEGPLRRLEAKNGHKEFLNYRQERRRKAEMDKEEEQHRLQRNLDDLKVRGDPRDYQKHLLEIALQKNTIVNLGTGTGKTLIALMCIKEMRASDPDHKQMLFLVPSVALAIQHSLTLQSNLPNFKIESAYHEKRSRSQTSKERLKRCDVIVATHGAILDMLMHYGDMFSLDSFQLIVMDECHYACGNHPYRHLMTKFYHTLPPKDRPHILGLTASPLISFSEHHTDEQLSGFLDNLEKTMDALLVSASGLESSDTATSSLKSRTIEEEVIEYRSSNSGRSIPSAKNLKVLRSRYKEFEQLEYLYRELGPLVLRIYCQVLLRELSRNFFEGESNDQFQQARQYIMVVKDFCEQETKIPRPAKGRTDKLLALEELLEDLIERDEEKSATGLVFVERRVTAMALHCYFCHRRDMAKDWKCAKDARIDLRKAEQDYFDSTAFCSSDIFDDSIDDPLTQASSDRKRKGEQLDLSPRMERRNASVSDAAEDPSIRKENDMLRSVALVRNPTQIFNSLSLQHHKLNEAEMLKLQESWIHKDASLRDTLASLRSGDTNLLFATSVVEEGVDVQACSRVVAFDGISSVKGYVQMKGRARHEEAKFYLFRDPWSGEKKKLDLQTARDMEIRINRIVEERMRINDKDTSSSYSEASKGNHVISESSEVAAVEAGKYEVGEALVDLHSAKSLLHRFYVSLPVEDLVRRKKELLTAYLPCFENDKLELPSHFPHAARTVLIPQKYKDQTKKEKEKILSLMAVVRLHCNGLLNERLLPLTRNDMHTRFLTILSEETKRVNHVPRQFSLASLCKSTTTLHIYPLVQGGPLLSSSVNQLIGSGHSLAILTFDSITPFLPTTIKHKEFGAVTLSLGKATLVCCTQEQYKVLQLFFSLLFNYRWSRRSRNLLYEFCNPNDCQAVIPPYLLGILSRDMCLDFKMMKHIAGKTNRTSQERKNDAAQTLCSGSPQSPILCHTIYSEFRQYLVYGPSGKTCADQMPLTDGTKRSFKDYYKEKYGITVEDDEPLFNARCMWTRSSGLSILRMEESDQKQSTAVVRSILLPLSICVEASLGDAHVALLSLFLPQFLFLFERICIAEAFLQHCEAAVPFLGCFCRKLPIEQIATVLTAKSCSRDSNYDAWEWLGDGVLKLLQSDSLLKCHKRVDFIAFLHEGDLSMLRSVMGSNDRLMKVCASFGFEKFVMTAPLSRGKWKPSPLRHQHNAAPLNPPEIRNKTMADIVEALLGLLFIEFGYDACRKVGGEFGISTEFMDAERNTMSCDANQRHELQSIVQACTSYNFRASRLLEEAVTHPSATQTTVSSYQRLEWIGDAVVCLCVREWLFRHCANKLETKDLVMMEDAMVSNETLAMLSMKYGLPQFLNHQDNTLPSRMESYFMRIQTGSGLWNTDPPKTVSDVVESILGAIHMDGGFVAGQAAAQKMLAPVFDIVASGDDDDGSLLENLKHPKRTLQEYTGELADLMSLNEVAFTSMFPDCKRVLHHDRWDCPTKDGTSHISVVTLLGTCIVGVADESLSISKNQASMLLVKALEENPELKERVAICQSKIASATTTASSQQKAEGGESDNDHDELSSDEDV